MSDPTDMDGNDLGALKPEVVDRPNPLAIPDAQRFNQYLADMRENVETDPERIADDIVSRILASETVEDVLAPQAVEHARDLVDTPIRLHRGKVNQSEYEGGPGVYMICEAEVIADGRMTTFSCGGRNVMAQVYKLAQFGAFPMEVVIREAPKPTRQGFKPLWLEALGPRDKISGALGREAPTPTG